MHHTSSIEEDYKSLSKKEQKIIDYSQSLLAGYLVTIYGDAYKSRVKILIDMDTYRFKNPDNVMKSKGVFAKKYLTNAAEGEQEFREKRIWLDSLDREQGII